MENKSTVREKMNALNIQGWNYERDIVKVSVLPHLETLPDEKNAKIKITVSALWMSILSSSGERIFHERYKDEEDAIAEAKALKNLFVRMECEVEDDPEYPNDFSVTF